MNLEQINKIISDYDKLIDLIKTKVSILESIDPAEYSTYKGIDEINIHDGVVNVRCDDGYPDYRIFEFPLIWITKSDEELTEIGCKVKELRLERKRISLEETAKKVQLENQQRELDEYNRLKAKFEPKD